MNFQLISPESGNGYDYQVRFREPVVIRQNSKVKLNHAKLTTDTSVTFKEDQTITFSSSKCFPSVLPSDATPNDPFKNVNPLAIQKGTYTFEELQAAINQAIDFNFAGSDQRVNLYQAIDLRPADSDGGLPNDLVIGFQYVTNSDFTITDFNIDPDNSKDSTAVVGGNAVAYAKSSVTAGTPAYDSYALSDTHFLHWKRAEFVNEETFSDARIVLQTLNNLEDYVPATKGRIFAGFYGKEYADELLPSNTPARTTGTTLQVVSVDGATGAANQVPACFFGIEIKDGQIRFLWAKDGTTSIKNWESQNQAIDDMELASAQSLASIYFQSPNLDFQGQFNVVPYIKPDQIGLDNPEVYVRVYVSDPGQNGDEDNNSIGELIYDSQKTFHYFPYEFFKSSADASIIDYTDPNTINSQIPFNLLLAADHQNSGFDNVNYYEIDKENDGSDAEPVSIVEEYKMTFSEELAIVVNNSSTPLLVPNYLNAAGLYQTPNSAKFMYVTRGNYIINSRSYSLMLNGLPIKNYKNKSEASDGGFAKTILANLPAPFSTGTNIDNSTTFGNRITIYEPHQTIISDLVNNEISVNSFDIKIINMDTEEPATELTNSAINFTIFQ